MNYLNNFLNLIKSGNKMDKKPINKRITVLDLSVRMTKESKQWFNNHSYRAMKSLETNFDNCKEVLELLKGPNLVLTGSCVLQAYGLWLHKDPEDLDVAIYLPTDEQMKVINELKVHNIAKNEDVPDDYTRVTKLKLNNGSTIDIIVESDDQDLLNEDDYLKYQGYNLQPAYMIIQARSRYARDKDIESCQKLKELNFNLETGYQHSNNAKDIDDNLPY